MNIWSGSMIHEMDVEETIIQLLQGKNYEFKSKFRISIY